MRHSANNLVYRATVLGSDGATTLSASIPCGVADLMGRRLEQAQLISSETSHLIVMHAGDARTVTTSGYLLVDGTLYVVDYLQDPRAPRPKMWTEIYAHVERTS